MKDLEEFSEHLKTIHKSNWQKLFDLLLEIRRTESFGELAPGLSMMSWRPKEIVITFLETVYDLGIIVIFDWMSWQEGEAMLKDKNTDYTRLDSVTLCKLLTAIVRNDRFVDGYLISCFEEEIIEKIIKGLKVNIEKY